MSAADETRFLNSVSRAVNDVMRGDKFVVLNDRYAIAARVAEFLKEDGFAVVKLPKESEVRDGALYWYGAKGEPAGFVVEMLPADPLEGYDYPGVAITSPFPADDEEPASPESAREFGLALLAAANAAEARS